MVNVIRVRRPTHAWRVLQHFANGFRERQLDELA
jgi:hypothetical protein